MKNFDKAVRFVLKKEGGFQIMKQDSGNYNSKGQLIGTNRGISAPVLEKFLGRVPTTDDMKMLDESTAITIYKCFYWDKMRGDQINNLAVAVVIFDWYVNAGSPAIIHAQLIVGVNADGIVGPKTTDALNKFDARTFFERYQAARKAWYIALVKRHPKNDVFLKGWLRRVDSIKYEQWAA